MSGRNGRRGIPTRAYGYRFRSRLEARWAHFFTLARWEWEYEPVDLDGWIPDFLLQTTPNPTLVEVKPDASIVELGRHVAKIEAALGAKRYEALLLGCTPYPRGEANQGPAGGLLGAVWDSWDSDEQFEAIRGDENCAPWNWEPMEWVTCRECGQVVFFDSIGPWFCRLCGKGGKVYLGPDPPIRALWAEACNATQWNRP